MNLRSKLKKVCSSTSSSPLLVLLLASDLASCSASTHSCSSIAVPAVRVTAVDESGDAVCDVEVHVQGPNLDDESSFTKEACSYSGGNGPGRYVIAATRGQMELVEQSVTVTADDCGPVTQDVTIKVPPS